MRKLALLAAFSLCACAVGPDYERPKTDVPAQWRIDFSKAAEVANTKWWEQFGDPALNQLIEEALRATYDVLAPPPRASTSSSARLRRPARSSTRRSATAAT